LPELLLLEVADIKPPLLILLCQVNFGSTLVVEWV
jgi:hypothetical protein